MDVPHQLQASLSTTSIPVPSLSWLEALAGSRSPAPPLASLLATARARLLASDLTTPGLVDERWAAGHSLPAGLPQTHAGARETPLPRDVVVQVLDIEDVTRSRWEQVEALEALARGEGTRGREIIRLNTAPSSSGADDPSADVEGVQDGQDGGEAVAGTGTGGNNNDNNNNNNSGSGAGGSSSSKNATHKLVVQDCKGQKVHAIELKRVAQLGVGKTFIGEKILLRAGTILARGVILLDPARCVMLGGKVDSWHRAWLDGRLARLKEAVGADKKS